MILILKDLEGGQSRDLWGGGASLETFSGEAQLKKTPCKSNIDKYIFDPQKYLNVNLIFEEEKLPFAPC